MLLDGIVAHPDKMIVKHKVASDLAGCNVLEVTFPFTLPRVSGDNVKAPIGAHVFEFMISFFMGPTLSKGMENVVKLQLQVRAIVCRRLHTFSISMRLS